MYSKAEASQLKKEFWTAFGAYMKPVFNSEGENINWINYKTGIKNIYFRMDADNKKASVSIELSHPPEERKLVYEHLQTMKNYFTNMMGEEWTWMDEIYDEDGRLISKIYKEIDGVNIFNREHWPQIISFLKERIIKLDEFWAPVKMQFE